MRDDFTERLAAATERYIKEFPGKMPDMRSMADRDYYELPDLMDRAILRGSPISPADFPGGIVGPDPDVGRVL